MGCTASTVAEGALQTKNTQRPTPRANHSNTTPVNPDEGSKVTQEGVEDTPESGEGGHDGGGGGGGLPMYQFNEFSQLASELVLDKEIADQATQRTHKRPRKAPVERRDPSERAVITDFSVMTLIGHSKAIKLCAVSPDETKIASACIRDNVLILWEVSTGKPTLILDGHDDGVLCCTFSPDNRFLVSGSIDNSLIVWDTSTGKMLHKLQGHRYLVCACAFSRDGSLIVSGSGDNSLIIWSAKSGIPLVTLHGHTKIVSACCFSPDGSNILSASADRTMIIWDTKTGMRYRQLRAHFDVILSCSYSADGKRICSNDKRNLKVWDVATGTPMFSFPITPSSLSTPMQQGRGSEAPLGGSSAERRFNLCAFSPDGWSVVSCSNDKTATLWDPDTGQEVVSFYCRQSVIALGTGPHSLMSFGDEAGNIYVVKLSTITPKRKKGEQREVVRKKN